MYTFEDIECSLLMKENMPVQERCLTKSSRIPLEEEKERKLKNRISV